jgi:hypothetical protein
MQTPGTIIDLGYRWRRERYENSAEYKVLYMQYDRFHLLSEYSRRAMKERRVAYAACSRT